jgi:hypothetical protein
MLAGYGNVIGIRLRAMDGSKWAVKGSRNGIFIPRSPASYRCYICEGPTDTASALTMGLYAIGRPSCSGGGPEALQFLGRSLVREVAIIADNDEPGLRGAKMLQIQLPIRSAILILPCKDIREMLNRGGGRDEVEELASNLVWSQPTES